MNTKLTDNWLGRWLPLIKSSAGDRIILELGCGEGRDSHTLGNAGLALLGIDKSESAIKAAKTRCPQSSFKVHDIVDVLPTLDSPFPVIVASLSLHYFKWDITRTIFEEIRKALDSEGLFVCRVNSTNDTNYGSTGFDEVEPDFYQVRTQTKRFFDEVSVDKLFADGWQVRSRQELTIARYDSPKVVWEIVANKICA